MCHMDPTRRLRCPTSTDAAVIDLLANTCLAMQVIRYNDFDWDA